MLFLWIHVIFFFFPALSRFACFALTFPGCFHLAGGGCCVPWPAEGARSYSAAVVGAGGWWCGGVTRGGCAAGGRGGAGPLGALWQMAGEFYRKLPVTDPPVHLPISPHPGANPSEGSQV